MNFGVFINVATLGTKQQALELDKKPLDKFVKRNGLYVLEEEEFKANTLVRNFNIAMYSFLQSNGTIQVYDTSNTLRTCTNGVVGGTIFRLFRCDGVIYGAGVTTGGILVGTGTDATTISTYGMQTLIAHGGGANQLQYGAMSIVGWSTSGSDSWFEVSRVLTNNSGSNITIKEIGLVGRVNSTSSHHVLGDRTLQDITINNGTGKTITYKFKITV
jgi:hypothetical protein